MMGSTTQELAELRAAVRKVLEDHCTPERLAATEGRTDRALWSVLEAAGFTRIGIDEDAGGSGGGIADAAAVLAVAGEYAAPVPLAEAGLLGGWLLAAAGLAHPQGISTVGRCEVSAEPEGEGWRLTGTVRRVPAARYAEVVVVIAESKAGPVVVALPVADLELFEGRNVAGEQRDDVVVDVVVPSVVSVHASIPDELWLRGALSRAVLLTGALRRVLHLAVRYSTERRQFGRPLSAFQAIQQQLALLAGEAAAAEAVVEGAVSLAGEWGFQEPAVAFAVGAAKVRTAQAATVAAAIAHQVHGALGMTREHQLRFTTTRLWAWRSEWGSEAHWSEVLAATAFAAGPDGLWPVLVGA